MTDSKKAALEKASPEGETPLDYLLRVMRDGKAEPKRRDAMALKALPYCHKQLSEGKSGKESEKESAQEPTIRKFGAPVSR